MSVLQGAQERHRFGMQRKLRRRPNASFPFFPYWLFPILSLGLLSLFATSCVQSTTQRTTDEALSKIGADWVRPDVSGRWVTLRGTPPDAANATAAYNAVKSAQSKTFFGTGIQATRVIEDYDAVAAPSVVLDPSDNDPAANIPAAVTEFTEHGWRFERKDNVITLTGEVPDEAMRTSIVESARFAANGARIDDQLILSNRVAAAGYSTTALRGVQAIGRCTSGVTSFTNTAFALNCEVPQADVADLRELASAPLTFGTIGQISILATEEIASCESQLADLLSSARVQFSTGSAVINATSANLLTAIANEAQTCPGVLRIEGHTDNVGSAELNAELSLARANAVRLALISRGLANSRLVAEGFGPSLPLASNATEAGRARNRRIQFRVVRP